MGKLDVFQILKSKKVFILRVYSDLVYFKIKLSMHFLNTSTLVSFITLIDYNISLGNNHFGTTIVLYFSKLLRKKGVS